MKITQASKLWGFKHLLGKVPDERVVELVQASGQDIKLSTVTAYRRALERGELAFEGTPVIEEPGPAREPETAHPNEAAAAVPDEPEREAEPCPDLVRVVRSAWVKRLPPVNMPHRVGRGDVYRGVQAAWLWEHHRELVEPFSR